MSNSREMVSKQQPLLLDCQFCEGKGSLCFVHNRAQSPAHSEYSANTCPIHFIPQNDNTVGHQKGCQRVFNKMGKYLKVSSEKEQIRKLYNCVSN